MKTKRKIQKNSCSFYRRNQKSSGDNRFRKGVYNSNGDQLVTDFEKNISLAILDNSWKTHLRKMDELKQSVQLAVHEQRSNVNI